MAKEDLIELEGTVVDKLPGGKFKVKAKLSDTETEVVCQPSGKLRTNYIKILIGDRVTIDVSPYDLTKGRITWRYK